MPQARAIRGPDPGGTLASMPATLPRPVDPCPRCGEVGALASNGQCSRCSLQVHDDPSAGPRVPLWLVRSATRLRHALTGSFHGGHHLAARAGALFAAALAALAATALAIGAIRALDRLLDPGGPLANLDLGVALLLAGGALAPVAAGLAVQLGAAGLQLEAGAAPADLEISEFRFRVLRLRGRRALSFQLELDTAAVAPGARVRVELRLRPRHAIPPPVAPPRAAGGPGSPPSPGAGDEGWLAARLPTFRGPAGEFVVRALSDPVGEEDSLRVTLGLLAPTVAVALPETPGPLELTAQVRAFVGSSRRAVEEHPVEFLALDMDRQDLAPPAGASEDEVRLVAAALAAPARCQVCGDQVDDGCPPCLVCETPQHRECWDYLRGCGTYACGGQRRGATP